LREKSTFFLRKILVSGDFGGKSQPRTGELSKSLKK
jgi:hypothetical protein